MKRTLISLLMTAAMLLSLLAGIPLRTSAAEQTEPAITLSIDGDRLNAQCAGLPANARIIAAGYDGSGQMKTVEVRTGKTPGFAYDRQYGYRVFAVDPDTSQPLCEATSRVELFSGQVSIPYIGGTAENGNAVARATRVAVRRSLDARIALEEVLALDLEAAYSDPDKQAEALALMDKAMAAYEDMEEAGAVLWAVAEVQADKEREKAATMEANGSASLQASDSELLHWAQNLTEQYDRIEGNKKMAELGKMMGCDARTAYQQFVVAQEILRNHYIGEANLNTTIINGLTVVKTGCKIGMFVGTIIASGGVSAVGAAGMVAGSTDCLIEVTNTGATLIYGDESKEAKLVENITKPVSDFLYVYSLLTLDTSKMNDGQIIAALGDWYFSVKDHYGEVIDKLDGFEMDDGGNLKTDVKSDAVEPEDVEEMILPEDDTGTDDGKTPNEDALKDAKKDLEKDLKDEDKEITDEDLEEILEEGGVLDKDQTLKDFNDTKKKDFEKEVIIRIKEKEPPKPKPDDPTPTPPPEYPIFHDDGPGQQHREVYWENEHGKFGLYERYYEDVLVDRTFYDDEGVIKWAVSYDYNSGTPEQPGRVTSRIHWSNGEEVGSVRSETHYYYEPDDVALFPEGVTEQVFYTTYQIVETYYNEEKSSDDTRWVWYYESPHLTYDPYGNLVEERTGEGTHWKMQKVYDKEENLSVQTEDNGDGTHTRTHLFTKQQSNYFKNLGDPWMRGVYTHENDYTGYLNMPPGDGELVKSERWQVEDYWEESDGNGNRTVSFGYRHTIEYPERSESFIWKGDVPE